MRYMPDNPSSIRNGVPGTNVACLYSTFPDSPWIDIIEKHLTKKKYHVISKKNATVEDLMNLLPCSVFGLDSHGYILDFDNNPIPCIYTADEFTDVNRINYGSLLDAVPPMLVKYHIKEEGDRTEHLAITAEFIKTYWKDKFARNGFVYFNCCHVSGDKTGEIRDAILNYGKASLFAGWSLMSRDLIGPQTATYLFSRLLGGNKDDLGYTTKVPDENPPQRPFRYYDLKEDMKKKGFGTLFDDKYCQQTNLEFFEGGGEGDLGLLSPSIKYVEVDEDKSLLTLYGIFGKRPNKDEQVTVNGKRIEISEWINPRPYLDDKIVCKDLPCRDEGSEGDVVVTINGIESNKVPLTGWHGKFTYTIVKEWEKQSETVASLTFPVFLRGDIHRLRDKPGEKARPRPTKALLVHDPKKPLEISLSGSCTHGNKTYEWSGSGKVPPGGDPHGNFTVFVEYQITSGMEPRLMVAVSSDAGKITVKVDGKPILSDSPWPVTVGATYDSVLNLEMLQSEVIWNPDIEAPGNFDIPAKTRTWQLDFTDDHNPPIFKATLTWEDMRALFPPDGNTEV
jgi:hypothetical protein